MGRWHAASLRALGIGVAGIVDNDSTVAAVLAAQHGNPPCFSDLDRCLSEIDAAVMHICTPAASHLPIAKTALAHDAHLIIEKPLARDGAEAELIYELAERSNRMVCPVLQFAYQTGVSHVHDNLHKLGIINRVEINIASAGGPGQGEQAQEVLLEIAPHGFFLIQRLFPGSDLAFEGWHLRSTRETECKISGLHADAAFDFSISLTSRPTRCEMTVYGSAGTAFCNLFHGYSLIETGATGRAQKILQPIKRASSELAISAFNLTRRALQKEPAYPGLRALIASFYRALAQGRPGPISKDQSLAVVRAGDWMRTAL